jgi:superfamily I DNA and/or RNA helicase
MVELFAVIFKASVGDDEDSGPAATLTDQHRMHPDIADIVGHTFYPNPKKPEETILQSPPETHERFAKDPPFMIRDGSWLPATRVVWCDIPWIQRKEYSEGEIDGLFAAPVEAKAVVDVLDQLQPRPGKSCDIQLLSPYNDQLSEMRRAIEEARRAGRLGSMFEAPFDLRQGKRLGATVDEFQGSEADLVVVSLVRNNALIPWKSVGFLKEANRMNVLLSRARHKLIIVGSWEFFRSRCNEYTSPDEEYAYIGRMMKVVERAYNARRLARVDAPK